MFVVVFKAFHGFGGEPTIFVRGVGVFDVHEVCNVSEFDTCVFVFISRLGVCVDKRRFEAEVCVVNEVVVEFDLAPGRVPIVGEDIAHVCFSFYCHVFEYNGLC